LGVDLRAVWVRACTDTRLVVVLAGWDPDALDERGRTLSTAASLPSVSPRAELILGISGAGR
jgi:hypothetical protein